MKCPKCREEMPVLSKICPVCGYTVENEEGGESPIDFVHKMEGILLDVKNLPQPTFFRSMGQLSFIMMPIIALFMLAFAIVSEAGLFWILFLLFLILAIVAIVRKARGRLGNDRANTEFAELKNEMEYNRRIATHSYGKNTEVRKVMNEIEVELAKVERARKGASGRNVAIWIAILIVIFAAAGLGVFKMDRALNPDNTTGILGEAAGRFGLGSVAESRRQGQSHVRLRLRGGTGADRPYCRAVECGRDDQGRGVLPCRRYGAYEGFRLRRADSETLCQSGAKGRSRGVRVQMHGYALRLR